MEAIEAGHHDRHVVLLLAIAVIVANSSGNCLLRVGLASGPSLAGSPLAYLHAFANPWVILGVALLIVWILLQLSLLSWADLSYVLPVTSASYVLTAAVGVVAMGEDVSPTHWAGIALIVCGVVIVGRTPPLTTGRKPS